MAKQINQLVKKKKRAYRYRTEIVSTLHNQFFWHVVARNGNLVAWSGESYINEADCEMARNRLFAAIQSDDIEFVEKPELIDVKDVKCSGPETS